MLLHLQLIQKFYKKTFNNLLATTEMVNNYRSEAVQKLQQERKMLSELNSKAIGLSDKVRQQQSAKIIELKTKNRCWRLNANAYFLNPK